MYLDIFGVIPWLRICTYIGGIFTLLFYTAIFICLFVFSTSALHQSWASFNMSGAELRGVNLAIPVSAVGFFIDIYILVLPILGVAKLQMRTGRKIGIILIFMTGLLHASLPPLSQHPSTD